MIQTEIAEKDDRMVWRVDQQERDRLVTENLPEVNYIAKHIHHRIPEHVALEDLLNAGVVGLLEAIDHYDPSRNIKLMTFAKLRIKGAILDSLRDLDWSPRELRKKGRQIEEALHRLRSRMGRAPLESEVADEMGMSSESLDGLLAELRGLDLGSLEALAAQSERGDQIYNYLPTSHKDDPLYLCLQAELRGYLTQAIGDLPDRERDLLALYYVEELSMKEVGAVLGLGEGRISQIHSAILFRLRSQLQASLAPRPAVSAKNLDSHRERDSQSEGH